MAIALGRRRRPCSSGPKGTPRRPWLRRAAMPAKAPEPAPNPTAAAVKHPVGRPAPGRERSARRQIDPGNSSGPRTFRDLQKGNPQYTGHVIVGRVICEDGDDPSRVLAQMPIQSEGYFAGPVDDSHRPVCFRRAGYFPIQITPSGEPGSVEYVGEVRLKRMPETMASAVRGKIVLEGEVQPTPVKARLSLLVPFNRPSYGGRRISRLRRCNSVQVGPVRRVRSVTD